MALHIPIGTLKTRYGHVINSAATLYTHKEMANLAIDRENHNICLVVFSNNHYV